jgi:hypothetical protein
MADFFIFYYYYYLFRFFCLTCSILHGEVFITFYFMVKYFDRNLRNLQSSVNYEDIETSSRRGKVKGNRS